MNTEDIKQLEEAFQTLMGINGDPFVKEIIETGTLSDRSVAIIEDNIQYNGRRSICKYYGYIYYYKNQIAK